MNLAEVMHGAALGMEPSPEQVAILDGSTRVVLQCAMERTAVIRCNGSEPQVVRLDRVEVDAASLRWQQRGDLTRQDIARMRVLRDRKEKRRAGVAWQVPTPRVLPPRPTQEDPPPPPPAPARRSASRVAVRNCRDCGQPFQERHQFRCIECRERHDSWHYSARPCRSCHQCFTPASGRQWRCSICAVRQTKPYRPTSKVERVCTICGNTYTTLSRRSQVCGADCRRERARRQRVARGAAYYHERYITRDKALRQAHNKRTNPCWPEEPGAEHNDSDSDLVHAVTASR
jgi:hypothetical protein